MSKRGSSSALNEKRKDEKKPDRSPRKRRDRDRSPRRGGEDRDRSPNRRDNVKDLLGPPQPELQPRYPPQQFTPPPPPPLTTSVSQVLYEVQHEKFLRWPTQMKTNPDKRDMTKYCDFHRDHENQTDDRIQLKKRNQIPDPTWTSSSLCGSRRSKPGTSSTTSSAGPCSTSATFGRNQCDFRGVRRRWGVQFSQEGPPTQLRLGETLEVQAVSKLPRLDTTITFSDADLEGCQHPPDDPLVIRSVVANKTIHRALIDNGSSADIIFAFTFNKMGIGRDNLKPMNAHLRGFSGERILPLGSVQLVLTLVNLPCQATTMTKFLIVEAPSTYNMLLGRPSLNATRVVPSAYSAYHMVVKFPTENGVGKARGD